MYDRSCSIKEIGALHSLIGWPIHVHQVTWLADVYEQIGSKIWSAYGAANTPSNIPGH